jgi:hypothetical protein
MDSEYDIILDIMRRISIPLALFMKCWMTDFISAVVTAMLAIYALITNPLLLFVMVLTSNWK